MSTFCPCSKLVLSKLIFFVCLVCTNSVFNKVNVRKPANQIGEGQYKTVVSEGISFLMTSYRTTKTLIFKPVLESKVVVNIFDYH